MVRLLKGTTRLDRLRDGCVRGLWLGAMGGLVAGTEYRLVGVEGGWGLGEHILRSGGGGGGDLDREDLSMRSVLSAKNLPPAANG